MNAGELVEQLKKQDPEVEVVFGSHEEGETVRYVYSTVQVPRKVVLA